MVRVMEEGTGGKAKAGGRKGEVDTLRKQRGTSIKLSLVTPLGKPCTLPSNHKTPHFPFPYVRPDEHIHVTSPPGTTGICVKES